MSSLANFEFKDLLPTSIVNDPKFIFAAEILGDELKSIVAAISNILIYSRINELEEPLLSLLAWQFHVDDWSDSWTLKTKRKAVQDSMKLHKLKGTPWAVERQVSIAINSDAEALEWFNYGGDPYMFKVALNDYLENYDQVYRAILASKNNRSWLDSIQIKQEKTSGVYVGGVVARGRTTILRPQFKSLNRDSSLNAGIGIHIAKSRTVAPANFGPRETNSATVTIGGAIHLARKETVRMI